MGTKSFASFYIRVPITERIGLNGNHPFLMGLNQHLVTFSEFRKFHFNVLKERTFTHILHMGFRICCDFKIFHFEIDHLKTILMKNNYPSNFIDWRIKSFLNKLYTPKVAPQNAPKKFCFCEVLHLKFERTFKNYLVIN